MRDERARASGPWTSTVQASTAGTRVAAALQDAGDSSRPVAADLPAAEAESAATEAAEALPSAFAADGAHSAEALPEHQPLGLPGTVAPQVVALPSAHLSSGVLTVSLRPVSPW